MASGRLLPKIHILNFNFETLKSLFIIVKMIGNMATTLGNTAASAATEVTTTSGTGIGTFCAGVLCGGVVTAAVTYFTGTVVLRRALDEHSASTEERSRKHLEAANQALSQAGHTILGPYSAESGGAMRSPITPWQDRVNAVYATSIARLPSVASRTPPGTFKIL